MAVDKAYYLKLIEIRNTCIEYQTRIDIAIKPHQTIFASPAEISIVEENLKTPPVKPPIFRSFVESLYIQPFLKQTLPPVSSFFKENGFTPAITTIQELNLLQYSHLFVSRIILTQAIITLEGLIAPLKAELDKEEKDTKADLEASTTTPDASPEPSEEQGPGILKPKKTNEEIQKQQRLKEIRAAKRASLDQNKLLFQNYCAVHGIQLDQVDFEHLDTNAFLQSISQGNMATFTSLLERYPRLWNKIKNDPEVQALAYKYIAERAGFIKSLRSTKAEKVAINLGNDSEAATKFINTLNNSSKQLQSYGLKPEVIQASFTVSGRDLDSQIESLQSVIDGADPKTQQTEIAKATTEIKDLQFSKNLRKQMLLEAYWDPSEKKRLKVWEENDLFEGSGEDLELPTTEEEFNLFLENTSILEIIGSPIAEETTKPSQETTNASGLSQAKNTPQPKQKAPSTPSPDIKKAQNIASALQKVAGNPTTMAAVGIGLGAMAVGATIYTIIQNAVAGVFTGAGALAGAAIGQAVIPIPFLGAGIGSVIGAGVGNFIGWKVAPNGPSLSSLLGSAQSTAPSIGSGATSLATGTAANAASTLVPTASGVIQSSSSIAFNSLGNAINAGSRALAAISGANPLAGAGVFAAAAGGGATILVGVGVLVIFSQTQNFLTDSGAIENQYLTVTKIADADHFENDIFTTEPTKTITYTITMKPKTNPTTNIPYVISVTTATDSFSISSKQAPPPATPVDPQLASGVVNPYIGALPTEGRTFTYSITVNNTYIDTRITNTFSVDFTVEGEPVAQKVSMAKVVTIGNPPSDIFCIKFGGAGKSWDDGGHAATSAEWPAAEKEKMLTALSAAASYTTYQNLLCDRGEITLYRSSFDLGVPAAEGITWGGRTISDHEIGIYSPAVYWAMVNTRWTIFHELGHIISHRHPELFSSYKAAVPGKESLLASYPLTKSESEDFPETFGVFMTFRNKGYTFDDSIPPVFHTIDMPKEYPLHYNWIKSTVFDNLDEPKQ